MFYFPYQFRIQLYQNVIAKLFQSSDQFLLLIMAITSVQSFECTSPSLTLFYIDILKASLINRQLFWGHFDRMYVAAQNFL